MKAAFVPRSKTCSIGFFVPLHFLEGVGERSSFLFFLRANGGEQQVELTFEDEAYIPDIDAIVVRRGGFPRSCKTSGDFHRHG